MVVITESRVWKNVSHVSWINGTLVISLSMLNLCVFTFNEILIADSCSVLTKIQEEKTLGAFSQNVNQYMIPIYETCYFGDGNLGSYLNIESQLKTDDTMYAASIDFVAASALITDSSSVFNLQIAKLNDYISQPHTLTFSDTTLV